MTLRPQIKYSIPFFLLMGLLAAWVQQSDLDIALSAFFFDAQDAVFPYQYQTGLYVFGTKIVWWIPFGGALLLAVKAWTCPRGSQERWAWAGAALLLGSGPLLAGVLKHLTAMPRPLNADIFSGTDALPAYFWAKNLSSAGNALPSAHASAGFVLLAYFFVGVLTGRRRLTITGLLLGLGAGALFGFMRIVQGYHFLSQVMWACAIMGLYGCVLFTLTDWGRAHYLKIKNR